MNLSTNTPLEKILERIWTKRWPHEWLHAKKELRTLRQNSSWLGFFLTTLWASWLRWRGVPFDYIFHNRPFLDYHFYIDRRVLIPRTETEELVHLIINNLKLKLKSFQQKIRILDIGTGSGVIALSIAAELNSQLVNSSLEIDVYAIDISSEAIEVAEINCKKLLPSSNNVSVKLMVGDCFNISSLLDKKFDLIVSNPPYIGKKSKTQPDREVSKYEPSLALWSGDTGLEFYQRLGETIPNWLTPEGELYLEMGEDQANDVRNIFSYLTGKVIRDMSGKERFFYGVASSNLMNQNML